MTKLLHRCAVLLASGGLSCFAAPTLTESDLAQHFVGAIENKSLQAVSVGLLQGDGSATAHLGALSPGDATKPNDDTLYEIGSISKVFTSLLLAEAVVRGEVTLDTTIAELLPADVVLPEEAGRKITLRMLATHTSGLPRIPREIPPDNYTNPYANYGETELWASLRSVKLDAAPGTKASYSNLAAGLLGTLLARKAGLTYEELLIKRIAEPLGMKDTVIDPDSARRARFAPPFTSVGKPWSYWDFKALAGAGGIRSTLADMKRFAAVMLRPAGSPLAKAIELAWAAQDLAGSISGGGQALGWLIAGDRKTRWHNGMTGGFHAALFVNRELQIATVVLSNRSSPLGSELAETLVRRAAGLPDRPIANRNRAEVELTPEQVERCVGTFRLTREFALVFARQDHVLVLTPTGQTTDRLYAAAPDTFFSRRVEADIVFDFPAEGGPAKTLTLKQGGREMRATRE